MAIIWITKANVMIYQQLEHQTSELTLKPFYCNILQESKREKRTGSNLLSYIAEYVDTNAVF